MRLHNYDDCFHRITVLKPPLGGKPIDAPESYQAVLNRVTTHEEFQDIVSVLLVLGPYIHYDPVLLYKLLRIMKSYFVTVCRY